MKYYYDIFLNYNDVLIPYYEWEEEDPIERVLKIPLFHVGDIKDFILYHMKIETEYPNILVADGINAIALEIIGGEVVYLSSMSYEDENCVNELVKNMEVSTFSIEKKEKRDIPFTLRKEIKMQRLLFQYLEEMSLDELKLLYYEITFKEGKKKEKMIDFLKKDMTHHFNEQYLHLYQSLVHHHL